MNKTKKQTKLIKELSIILTPANFNKLCKVVELEHLITKIK